MDNIQALAKLGEINEYRVGVYIRGSGQYHDWAKAEVGKMRQEFIDALQVLGITDEQMMAAGVVHP